MAQNRRRPREVPRISGGQNLASALKTRPQNVVPTEAYDGELGAVLESLTKSFGSLADLHAAKFSPKEREKLAKEGERAAYANKTRKQVEADAKKNGPAGDYQVIAYLDKQAALRARSAHHEAFQQLIVLGNTPSSTLEDAEQKYNEILAARQHGDGINTKAGDIVFKALWEQGRNQAIGAFTSANISARDRVIKEEATQATWEILNNLSTKLFGPDAAQALKDMANGTTARTLQHEFNAATDMIKNGTGQKLSGDAVDSFLSLETRKLKTLGEKEGYGEEYKEASHRLRIVIGELMKVPGLQDGTEYFSGDNRAKLEARFSDIDGVDEDIKKLSDNHHAYLAKVRAGLDEVGPVLSTDSAFLELPRARRLARLEELHPNATYSIWDAMDRSLQESSKATTEESKKVFERFANRMAIAQDGESLDTEFADALDSPFLTIEQKIDLIPLYRDVTERMKLISHEPVQKEGGRLLDIWKKENYIAKFEVLREQQRQDAAEGILPIALRLEDSVLERMPPKLREAGWFEQKEWLKSQPAEIRKQILDDAGAENLARKQVELELSEEEPYVLTHILRSLIEHPLLQQFADQKIDTPEELLEYQEAFNQINKDILKDPLMYYPDSEGLVSSAAEAIDLPIGNADYIEEEPTTPNPVYEPDIHKDFNPVLPMISSDGEYIHTGPLTQYHLWARLAAAKSQLSAALASGSLYGASGNIEAKHVEISTLTYFESLYRYGGSATATRTLVSLNRDLKKYLDDTHNKTASRSGGSHTEDRLFGDVYKLVPWSEHRITIGGDLQGLAGIPGVKASVPTLIDMTEALISNDTAKRVPLAPTKYFVSQQVTVGASGEKTVTVQGTPLRRPYATQKEYDEDLKDFRDQRLIYENSDGLLGSSTIEGNAFFEIFHRLHPSLNDDTPIDLDFMERRIIPALDKLMKDSPVATLPLNGMPLRHSYEYTEEVQDTLTTVERRLANWQVDKTTHLPGASEDRRQEENQKPLTFPFGPTGLTFGVSPGAISPNRDLVKEASPDNFIWSLHRQKGDSKQLFISAYKVFAGVAQTEDLPEDILAQLDQYYSDPNRSDQISVEKDFANFLKSIRNLAPAETLLPTDFVNTSASKAEHDENMKRAAFPKTIGR